MAVRSAYIIEDIQQCIYNVISKLTSTTAPWTSWTAKLGYPEADVLDQLAKPIIYIMNPVAVNEQWQQGGLYVGFYEMTIGAWDDRKTGGPEEMNIIASALLNLFRNPSSCHAQQFNVVTDASYTNTTLITQGVRVDGIRGPREIATEEIKEFRFEFTLFLRT